MTLKLFLLNSYGRAIVAESVEHALDMLNRNRYVVFTPDELEQYSLVSGVTIYGGCAGGEAVLEVDYEG